jgi:hypothetical protein
MPSAILIGVDGCIAHRARVFAMNDFVELFNRGTTTGLALRRSRSGMIGR